jgi:3-oxoisoapionate decarboxylase
MKSRVTRRDFLQHTAACAAGVACASNTLAARRSAHPGHRLGLDNFAVRGMGWKAPQLVDYSASLGCTSLFISDLDAFDSLDDAALAKVREQATAKGLQIHLGTWSVCPTSKSFKPNRGTADEHLALGIRAAKAIGSPVIRVVLGTWEDRLTDGGIDRHIDSLLAVCRRQRSRALDAGVKIAIENHAGDMQAWELVTLIEEAGRDYVGATLDSGNATWTLEDPLSNLEILGPYAVTTGIRDSAVWETADGAVVQWTAMGEGTVDFKRFIERFAELCPGVPIQLEIISGSPRALPYLKEEFWKPYPKARASEFARFVALAKRGKPIDRVKLPEGEERKPAEQRFQKAELERSIKYCKEVLGLGLKASAG